MSTIPSLSYATQARSASVSFRADKPGKAPEAFEGEAQLLKEIRKDSDQINKLRQQLFSKPKMPAKRSGFMPSKLMGTGASVLDGLLLAWKLYRKFKRK